MKKKTKIDGESITANVEIVTIRSLNGLPDLFNQAAEYLNSREADLLINHVEVDHSGQSFWLKLYLIESLSHVERMSV